MVIKSIKQAKNLKGKRVLLRADFNVPIKNGVIQDDYKIIQGLTTINYLLNQQAKIIIMTHLGEPGPSDNLLDFTVKPIAEALNSALGVKVNFMPEVVSWKVETAIGQMKNGEVIMLENLRFHAGETKNDKTFAASLANLADIYVNDAFAVSHRNHASVSAIKNYLPAFAGLLLETEIRHLNKILRPKKPLVAIISGAKISTKIALLKNLRKRAWRVLVGGGIANNFLAAHKLNVGKSLVDKDSLALAKKLKDKNIILPVDVVVANSKNEDRAEIKSVNQVGPDDFIFDIGPKTVRLYSGFIKKAQTIIWNGPLGKFEFKQFRHGTIAIGRAIAARSKGKAFGVAGGGETVSALKMTEMAEYMDWVSTGGGAMLAYLGGESMPGLKKIVK